MIAPPKTSDFLSTNVSWLLDTKKDTVIEKKVFKYIFLCAKRSNDRRRPGVEGHRFSGEIRPGADYETGDFGKEKLGGATVVRFSTQNHPEE